MLSDKVEEAREEDMDAETAAQIKKEAQESLEQNFTPSLARRLSRQFIEQTRQSVPRSPSSARDSNKYYQSPTRDLAHSLVGQGEVAKWYSTSMTSDRAKYRSLDRGIRRTNSLLEPCKYDKSERHSPRRSISLFDDNDCDDKLPKHIMTLGRRYKESIKSNVVGNVRRDSLHGYRTEKIQEEPGDDTYACKEDIDNVTENGSISEGTSVCNVNATTSSVSARSCEVSPTESSSALASDYGKTTCRSDVSKSFENRLMAAENLIKESKLKNLTSQQFNPNLSSNYKDMDKCDKEILMTTSDPSSSGCNSKRRSCIPSLRLRSGSLTRESSANCGKFACSSDASVAGVNQERSILSKLFRGSGNGISKEAEPKDSDKKPKHRISRFLRPDFFDTPREESQYVKEKEAQKAAENERRKSRFMRRKNEGKEDDSRDEKICKELKNEINALQKDKLGNAVVAASVSSSSSSFSFEDKSQKEDKERAQHCSKSSFLHSLEKKLERLRSNEETATTSSSTKAAKPTMNGSFSKERGLRECSAPPVECPSGLPEAKRTLSVEDLSRPGSNKDAKSVPSKGRVTSVLGLFKTNANDTIKQNGGNVNKSKRSSPKCVKSTESSLEEGVNVTSKIPTTKFAKTDNKPMKKRSPENEFQRSPPKEKTKENESIAKGKKSFVEKQSREVKRAARASDSSASGDKVKLDKANSPKRKSSDQSECLRKVVEDKHAESIGENKKPIKTKRNLSSLVNRNESVARIDKGEDVKVDKKSIKKLVKSKEDEKDEIDGSRKKKIVRVVRKIVKKSSDSSESKSDEKGKSSKPLTKTTKKEKSPEGRNNMARGKEGSSEGNDPNDQTAVKSFCSKRASKSDLPLAKPRDVEHIMENTNTNQMKIDITADKFNVSSTDVSRANSQNCPNSQSALDSSSPAARIDSSFNISQSKQQSLEQYRPSRANLKLDLSKIPQHAFRHTTPKRDSPRSDSPKANPVISSIGSSKTDNPKVMRNNSDKLMECLSKMTHHANITGNKIIIDKPLQAKDVAELKRDVEIEIVSENHDRSSQRTIDQTFVSGESGEMNSSQEINDVNHGMTKEPPDDCTSEIFSPEEPESFDFWSICSADLNHNRGDLHSPTSPYSLFTRGDSSESVIDRIRRRSFYSRFNDRKRPSLTAPPPGVSVTLPRRYSFNSSRERDKLYNYRVPRTR